MGSQACVDFLGMKQRDQNMEHWSTLAMDGQDFCDGLQVVAS